MVVNEIQGLGPFIPIFYNLGTKMVILKPWGPIAPITENSRTIKVLFPYFFLVASLVYIKYYLLSKM